MVGGVEGGIISANHLRARARERSHAGVAHSDPMRARGNLVVVTGASVQQISFEERKEELAVDGTRNVRVVDASVMPIAPRGECWEYGVRGGGEGAGDGSRELGARGRHSRLTG